jgi:hypothetical protein
MASESLMQKMQARLAKLESQSNQFYKMKEGLTRLRVLPSWRGPDEEFFLEVLQHRDVTPDVKVIICPMTVGESCPIDRLVSKLSVGDSHQQARAERMAAKSEFMMNVIPIAEGNPPVKLEPTVKLYRAPRSVLMELISFYTDGEYGDFTDPKEGYDVLIRRTGQMLNTKYTVRIAKSPSRVPLKEWKSLLINLDKKFEPKPASEIVKLVKGGSSNGNGRPVRRPRQEEEEQEDIPENF